MDAQAFEAPDRPLPAQSMQGEKSSAQSALARQNTLDASR